VRLLGVAFDRDEEPETLTVEMTPMEAALIARLVGGISDTDMVRVGGTRLVDPIHTVYACLVDAFFNRFWEDGLNGLGHDVRRVSVEAIAAAKAAREEEK